MKKIDVSKLRKLMSERNLSTKGLVQRTGMEYFRIMSQIGGKGVEYYSCRDSTFEKIKNALNKKFPEVKDEDLL